MKKYNLLINQNFKELGFSDKIDDSIYATCKENMLQFSVIITHDTKPEDNTDSIDITEGDSINCYLFPLSNRNSMFNVGDLLYTHDNSSVFIIEAHIEGNKFTLKLVDIINGDASYSLLNTSPAILHNAQYERFMHENNELVNYVRTQRSEYTEYINNNGNFVQYFLEKIALVESDTTVGVTFNFEVTTDNVLFTNIINKFFLNMQIFDYNDFKYIYSTDIKSGENKTNESLESNDRIIGVLKSLQTKILPHYTQQLLKTNTYTFTTDTINQHTKYSRSFDKDKLILVFQLTLKDKSIIYDQDDNIESDYMYLIL